MTKPEQESTAIKVCIHFAKNQLYFSNIALLGIIVKSIKLSIWPQINKHLPFALSKTTVMLGLRNHNERQL
mgnify:FL=1